MNFRADIFGFFFGSIGTILGIQVGTYVTTATAILSFFIALVSLLVMIDKHTKINIPFIHTDQEGQNKQS